MLAQEQPVPKLNLCFPNRSLTAPIAAEARSNFAMRRLADATAEPVRLHGSVWAAHERSACRQARQA